MIQSFMTKRPFCFLRFIIGGGRPPVKKARSEPQALDVLFAGEDDVAAELYDAGQAVEELLQKPFHLLAAGGDGVDVQLAAARHEVDLRDGVAAVERIRRGLELRGLGLDLKVGGDGAADLLRVDDRRVASMTPRFSSASMRARTATRETPTASPISE